MAESNQPRGGLLLRILAGARAFGATPDHDGILPRRFSTPCLFFPRAS